MLPDRVSNQDPLTYESGALLIALRGPAHKTNKLTVTASPEIFLSEGKDKVCCIVALLFYVHGKHLRSCRDGQLTLPHFSWAGLDLLSG